MLFAFFYECCFGCICELGLSWFLTVNTRVDHDISERENVVDEPVCAAITDFESPPNHSTVKYAAKKLLNLREQKSRDLGSITKEIRNLEDRSKRLKEVTIISLPHSHFFSSLFSFLLCQAFIFGF